MQASEVKVTRHANRYFPKLATGYRLVRVDERWRIVSEEGADHGWTVNAEVVQAWLARNWLTRCGDGAAELSPAGRAWLRREGTVEQNPFRSQHQILHEHKVRHDGRWQRVTINAAENPLSWLARRKDANGSPLITPEQLAAGEKLRRDYTLAGMVPRVTTQWNPSFIAGRGQGGGGGLELQDSVLAARTRLGAALDATGPELGKVLLEICCLANGLEAAERMFGWPPRSAKVVLQIALTQLARYYGLIGAKEGRSKAGSIRSWGAKDYRPGM